MIRKDPVRVARLKEFLSWKELRKNAKPGEEGVIATDAADDELFGLTQDGESALRKGPRKRPLGRLPWDSLGGLLHAVGLTDADGLDEDMLDGEEALADTQRRLYTADLLTRDMSREEYMEYSECRQASFTYKKAKKFRDWINPAQYIDFRLNDDVIEIVGFLAWEIVRRVTEVALRVKQQQQTRPTEPMGEREEEGVCRLFASPLEKTAITPDHLHAAILMIEHENGNPYEILSPSPLYRRRVGLF